MLGSRGGGSRRPTMRDVAALAGVGLKTVSRVVNQEPHVSPRVRERVQDAISVLGYERNMDAVNLRRGPVGFETSPSTECGESQGGYLTGT